MTWLFETISECWKMGCVSSKKDINDIHPNIFQVNNVDDMGNTLSPGQLEVNETELVLHQRGKTSVRWPLKSLRRYGYERQVFSFEAGRRCPTGSGIYAFSCQRAEKLFNFVQAHVQMRNSEDTLSREMRTPTPSQTRPSGGFLDPSSLTPTTTSSSNTNNAAHQPNLPRLSLHNNPSRLNSVGSSNGCVSPSPPALMNNNYSTEFFPSEGSISESAVYMNVNCKDAIDEELPIYANLTPGALDLDLDPTSTFLAAPPSPTRNVNYITLDLNQPSTDGQIKTTSGSGGPPESPVRPVGGYATIDFDKTVALSHSANPSFDFDEGCRKTRHSSTIGDLFLIGNSRQNSSVSD